MEVVKFITSDSLAQGIYQHTVSIEDISPICPLHFCHLPLPFALLFALHFHFVFGFCSHSSDAGLGVCAFIDVSPTCSSSSAFPGSIPFPAVENTIVHPQDLEEQDYL